MRFDLAKSSLYERVKILSFGYSYNATAGYHNNALMHYPAWANDLHYPYWKIRVEGRDQALRRKWYRRIREIKLKLVEKGYDIEEINLICRYLVSHKYKSVDNYEAFKKRQKRAPKQLLLAFF